MLIAVSDDLDHIAVLRGTVLAVYEIQGDAPAFTFEIGSDAAKSARKIRWGPPAHREHVLAIVCAYGVVMLSWKHEDPEIVSLSRIVQHTTKSADWLLAGGETMLSVTSSLPAVTNIWKRGSVVLRFTQPKTEPLVLDRKFAVLFRHASSDVLGFFDAAGIVHNIKLPTVDAHGTAVSPNLRWLALCDITGVYVTDGEMAIFNSQLCTALAWLGPHSNLLAGSTADEVAVMCLNLRPLVRLLHTYTGMMWTLDPVKCELRRTQVHLSSSPVVEVHASERGTFLAVVTDVANTIWIWECNISSSGHQLPSLQAVIKVTDRRQVLRWYGDSLLITFKGLLCVCSWWPRYGFELLVHPDTSPIDAAFIDDTDVVCYANKGIIRLPSINAAKQKLNETGNDLEQLLDEQASPSKDTFYYAKNRLRNEMEGKCDARV